MTNVLETTKEFADVVAGGAMEVADVAKSIYDKTPELAVAVLSDQGMRLLSPLRLRRVVLGAGAVMLAWFVVGRVRSWRATRAVHTDEQPAPLVAPTPVRVREQATN